MQNNLGVRIELFNLHRRILSELESDNEQPGVFEWYSDHIATYPQFLTAQSLDLADNAFVPRLAGQVWINLLESRPEDTAHRADVAEVIGFTGTLRNILVDFGTLLIENDMADQVQLTKVHDYLSTLPTEIWNSRRITINDFLGPNTPETDIASRTGVNIFSTQVGQFCENSFPPLGPSSFVNGPPRATIDVFSVVLAHEIAHTTDASYIFQDPALGPRLEQLRQQAQPLDLNFLRSQIGDSAADFFRSAPQEFYASMTNQWATSSEVTLQLAMQRFADGFVEPLNQALFLAEVHSVGGDTTTFYDHDCAGRLTTQTIPVRRDISGNISELFYSGMRLQVDRTSNGNAVAFEFLPAPDPTIPAVITNPSGTWFNAQRNGEGWVIEKLSETTAGLYWFTYPVGDSTGEQLWLLSIGRIEGDRYIFDDVRITRGAEFGENFNPADVIRENWGNIEFRFSDDNNAVVTYTGPVEFGTNSFAITRLSKLDSGTTDINIPSNISGSWFDPQTDGEGWLIQQISSNQAVVGWFTYDANGNQAWNIGITELVEGQWVLDNSMRGVGAEFGSAFNPEDVESTFFGRLIFVFDDCNNATLDFDTLLGNGSRNLQRLTSIQDFACTDQ